MSHSSGAEWWRPAAARGSTRPETTVPQEGDNAVPFAALMVLTVVALLAPQQYLPGLARLRPVMLSAAFAIVAYCWTRLAARRPLVALTREIRIIAILVVWAVATFPLSGWIAGDLGTPWTGTDPAQLVRSELPRATVPTPQELRSLYPRALIAFVLISQTVTTLPRLRMTAWGLSLMAVPMAATGVMNFAFQRTVAGRIPGYNAPLTTDPGDLALMLNLILPLTVALLLMSRRPLVRGLLGGILILDAAAIIVTFSRTGFVMLLVTIALYLRALHRWREWKWAIAALALVVAAVPLLPHGYADRLDTIINVHSDPTGSFQERWRDMRTAVTFALTHPLIGAGVGNHILVLNALRGPTWQPVHNVYLQYAMDLGWLGLALFVLLLVACVQRVRRVHDDSVHIPALRDLAALAAAVRIALVSFAVAALAYPVAYNLYFYYFAGIAVAIGRIYDTHQTAAGTAS